MKILAFVLMALGIVSCLLAYATWGIDNHVISLPYHALAVLGIALLVLGIVALAIRKWLGWHP